MTTEHEPYEVTQFVVTVPLGLTPARARAVLEVAAAAAHAADDLARMEREVEYQRGHIDRLRADLLAALGFGGT